MFPKNECRPENWHFSKRRHESRHKNPFEKVYHALSAFVKRRFLP